MTTMLDDLRKLADETRRVAEDTIPIRTVQVVIKVRVWSRRRGEGPFFDQDLVMPTRYPVRFLSSKEVNSSGGRYTQEDVKWGPITPSFDGGTGGYTIALLNPKPLAGEEARTEILYVLSGAIEGVYKLDNFDSPKPFRYMLTLKRMRLTP
jgi:hypothetical protein